jgi:hypothetical protein
MQGKATPQANSKLATPTPKHNAPQNPPSKNTPFHGAK